MIEYLLVLLVGLGLGALSLYLYNQEKKNKKYSMPRNRIDVDWSPLARKKGLSGMFAKVMRLVAQGRELPYSRNYVKAYKENYNAPVFDKTEEKPRPEPEIFSGVNPGELVWEE